VKRGIPKEGDIVSFKHRGFLMGTNRPKLPQLYRIRTDIEWADVVNNWKEKKPSVTGISSYRFFHFLVKPHTKLSITSCAGQEILANA